MIKAGDQEQLPVVHPENPEICRRDDRAAVGPAGSPANHRRNAVDRSRPARRLGPARHAGPACIDRSPCGTGTCAKMATLHARGELGIGARRSVHESDPRHGFHRAACSRRRSGWAPYRAVVPEISGHAWITGFAQYVVDPRTRSRTASPSATSGAADRAAGGDSAARRDQPRFVGQDDGLDPVAQAELGQDPADVDLHGAPRTGAARRAISRLDRPAATAANTSRSRSVSGREHGVPCGSPAGVGQQRQRTGRAAGGWCVGASTASPAGDGADRRRAARRAARP